MANIGTDILLAKQLLERGGVIGIPTETVYGLAANAYDEVAVSKIFDIKQRPKSNPLILHIHRIEQMTDLVKEFPMQAEKLAKHCWPGPLTLLLPKKLIIPDVVTAASEKVAIRIPNHPITLQLLQALSFPLAAPSANPFGYISPTTPEHVQEQLGEQIPYILAGGACEVGVESTIVGFENEQPVIYRLGGLRVELIEEIVGPAVFATKNIALGAFIEKPAAPGNFLQHYSPKKPLKLGVMSELLERYRHKKVGILVFDKYYEEIDKEQQILLTPSSNLEEAAHNLFAALRKLDQLPVEIILSTYVPNIGLGRTINDRLVRASAR
ncbi:MAG: threonylcarbamoyl-AMP synthase [Candidatus Amoebophilus sp. 36-38]|nr:MAG: threonylcarbamoyl-AMP synthase [Candidatus Amoebophilus sp. 36-38]